MEWLIISETQYMWENPHLSSELETKEKFYRRLIKNFSNLLQKLLDNYAKCSHQVFF